MWFAGLRGAISFALSLNMPGEHKDLYVTTTLSLIIFTTIFLGGFTERVLSATGMKLQNKPNGKPFNAHFSPPSPVTRKMAVGNSNPSGLEVNGLILFACIKIITLRMLHLLEMLRQLKKIDGTFGSSSTADLWCHYLVVLLLSTIPTQAFRLTRVS